MEHLKRLQLTGSTCDHGSSVPDRGTAEPDHAGVTAHEHKGAHSGETRSKDCSTVQQEHAGIISKTQTSLKKAGQGIKTEKSAHQQKDAFGSSGLGGHTGPANVLHLLPVSVQDEDHVAAGPEHEPHAQNIRECQQCCIQRIVGFVMTDRRAESKVF